MVSLRQIYDKIGGSPPIRIRNLTKDNGLDFDQLPVDVENINENFRPYRVSLEKRIHNFVKSTELLLENYFTDPETKEYYLNLFKQHNTKLQKVHNEISMKRKPVSQDASDDEKEKYYKKLEKDYFSYMASLTEFISKATGMTLEKSLLELRNAENIVSWEQQRPTTLTVYNSGNDTIVQIFEPITNLTKNQAKEYLEIYKQEAPAWFQRLDSWHKNYLKNKLKSVYKNYQENDQILSDNIVSQLNETLNTIPATIRNYPGLANYGHHKLMIFDENGDIKFSSKSERGSSSNVEAIRGDLESKNIVLNNSLENCRGRLTKQNVDQLLNPIKIEEKINAFENDWDIQIDEQDNFEFPILYGSNLSPLKADSQIEQVRRGQSGQFLKWLYRKGNEGTLNFDNNTKMVEEADNAFSKTLNDYKQNRKQLTNYPGVKLRGIRTNYAVNSERVVADQPDTIQNKQRSLIDISLKTLELIAFKRTNNPKFKPNFPKRLSLDEQYQDVRLKNLDSNKNLVTGNMNPSQKARYELALAAIYEYKNMVDHKLGDSKGNGFFFATAWNRIKRNKFKVSQKNNNLFLASYEQLIISQLGGVGFGHCKSGKDRKGLELMHTDCMLIYYHKYGKLPKSHDDQKFIDIFVDHFRSKHQQLLCEYNAPGCQGIVNLKDTLPKSLYKAIKKDAKLNQRNAKLNKPKFKKMKDYLTDTIFTSKKRKHYNKNYKNLTDNTSFEIPKIEKLKRRKISSYQKLSDLHNSQTSVQENVEVYPTQVEILRSEDFKKQFENSVNYFSTNFNISNPKFEQQGNLLKCTYQNESNISELTIGVEAIHMKEYNSTSMKIAIKMIIDQYGKDAEISFYGVNKKQEMECNQIREQIISSMTEQHELKSKDYSQPTQDHNKNTNFSNR
ncbi:MAG: hypothetical protein HRT87_08355 [Legionellales bacterium]|nr:hypothetical protein [Legionellales bacterium]